MCESPQAFNSVTRTARKKHQCCECRSDINKGDKYQYSSGVWDGRGDSYKQCLGCHDIMAKAAIYDRNNYGDGVSFEGVAEWFYGFMCIGFKGEEFLKSMASDVGVTPEKLDKLLKIRDREEGDCE